MGKLTTQLIPLESVVLRVLELLPQDAVSEERLEEWAYEAYESIAPHDVYETNVCFVTVNNNMAPIPKGAFRIDMVLYSIPFNSNPDVPQPDASIYTAEDPEYKVQKEYLDRFIKPTHQSNWKPLRYTSNSFHSLYMCKNSPNHLILKHCNETFSINPRNKCFVTSFSKGYLAVAYAGLPTDDKTGQFLIPDKESIKKAIETYCLKRYWQYQLNMREEGASQLYQLYSQEYELLSAKATGELIMPDFIEYQNLRNVNKFIKEDSPFSTALGALNNDEFINFGKPSSGYYYNHFFPNKPY